MKKDSRPRKERRADPDRWYQVVDGALSELDPGDVNLPDGVFVRGQLDDVIVVAVRSDHPDFQAIADGTRQVLEAAGYDRSILFIPDAVQLLKLRPLNREKGKQLDRGVRLKRIEAKSQGRTIQ